MGDVTATSPAGALATAIRAKAISSRELLDLYVDRIERLGPPVNAVVTFDIDRARDAAALADERTARGESAGPLHGLPVTIKDAIETEGIRSTGGSSELASHVPARDAPAVARLKGSGAIVFGKTNLSRWSGDLQTFNELFGTTSNPWALGRSPGGSSGGAAVAVACGFTSFELGTDLGGSIRNPSHFCGTYGLKPSFGIVPQRGNLDHVGGGTTDTDIVVFGPMARSADDLELLLSVLAGPEPERAVAWHIALPPAAQVTPADFRIGVWFDEPACPVANEYGTLLKAAADALADGGARVEEAHPPVDFSEQVNLFLRMGAAAGSLSMPEEVGAALAGSHLAWLKLDEERGRLRAVWSDWFAEFDVLLCPVAPTTAFPHTQDGDITTRTIDIDGASRPYLELTSWVGLIGVLGLPSAVAPIGRTATESMPAGIQIVSPFLHDLRSIHLARLMTDIVGGYTPPPGFAP
jgi:amidase